MGAPCNVNALGCGAINLSSSSLLYNRLYIPPSHFPRSSSLSLNIPLRPPSLVTLSMPLALFALGSAGLLAPRIGLGVMSAAFYGSADTAADEKASLDAIDAYVALCSPAPAFLDTAWIYTSPSGLHSESIVAKAIAKHGRSAFVIATKVSRRGEGGVMGVGSSPLQRGLFTPPPNTPPCSLKVRQQRHWRTSRLIARYAPQAVRRICCSPRHHSRPLLPTPS